MSAVCSRVCIAESVTKGEVKCAGEQRRDGESSWRKSDELVCKDELEPSGRMPQAFQAEASARAKACARR